MVIGDFNSTENNNKNNNKAYKLADPGDRLAATIVDIFVVLLPLVTLFIAPIRKALFESALVGDELSLGFVFLLGCTIVIFSGLLYYTLSFYFYGTTIGYRFFKIYVADVFTYERPDLYHCFIRSVFLIAGYFLLFIPFISVFSNNKRRAFHDRASDTVVLTGGRPSFAPSYIESSIAKGVFSGIFVLLLLIASVSLFATYKEMRGLDSFVSQLEDSGELCKIVGQAQEDWPEEKNEPPTRLNVAMALYASGVIDKDDCLEPEVELSFQSDSGDASAYLARAFIYMDKKKLSNSYLEKVCHLDDSSDECKMTKVIEAWENQDYDTIKQAYKRLGQETFTYVNIWKINHYIKSGDYELASGLLEDLPKVDQLNVYKTQQQAKVLWGQQEFSQAQAVAEVGFLNFNLYEKVELASWLCFQEVSASCGNLASKSCQLVSGYTQNEPKFYEFDYIALSDIRKAQCRGHKLPRGLAKHSSREIRKIADIVSSHSSGSEKYKELMWGMMANSNNSEYVRAEAARYLVDSAGDKDQATKLLVYWKVLPKSHEWQKTGLKLFSKLVKLQLYAEAFNVGQKIEVFNINNQEFYKKLAIASYESGDKKKAWTYVKNIIEGPKQSMRQPASSSQLTSVIRKILTE